MSIASRFLRYTFGKSDAARDAGLTAPADIRSFDDIVYGEDARWEVLDVYRPRSESARPLPVIVSVHGGGWVYGSKEVYRYYCMDLARRGFAVVNFTYHLAPEHKYPTQLEETDKVFHWLVSHGAEYGADTEAVFAVGDSAGASLLGQYCAICTSPDYAAGFPFSPPAGFVPKAVALNCGQYRVEPKPRPTDLGRLLMRDYLPQGGSREELEQLDVTAHIGPDFPPVFLMTANGDFLRDQAPLLERRLRENGVRCEYRCYGDEENRLGHVFHCDVRSEHARRCNDEECDFFREFV